MSVRQVSQYWELVFTLPFESWYIDMFLLYLPVMPILVGSWSAAHASLSGAGLLILGAGLHSLPFESWYIDTRLLYDAFRCVSFL